jgi:hypothetical protein
MKQEGINNTLHRWTTHRAYLYLMLLCIVYPLLNFPAAEIISSPLPLASADSQSSKTAQEIEYEVKAAFIYNFMKFIEWPEDSTNQQNSQQVMAIGILGNNPFGDAFIPILDKEVHGRKINLVEIPSYQTFYDRRSDKANAFAAYRAQYQSLIETCDVLFLCLSEKNHVTELTELTPGRGILTISDIPGFAKHTGIIGFIKDNNKIRFEINLDIAQREEFKIRSQLLALAKEV